ncbi:IS110 family transposase [Priestia filamentosa]|uniref:IS110 family transposase n=1 Tax=Priestia filamentosa TaxID=1402861 RepID=UPI000A0881FA|nr:IS110 family transposase [Priestia filamentosa]OXS64108.1 IS110 family transposase [Priestia filamentosa]SMF76019.1 Transposase [Priestia filamentosa]
MKLFIGLDVSSQGAKVCFLNGEGDRLQSFTIPNDLPGEMKLKEIILQTAFSLTCEVIKIGLESTSIYSYHPAMFLHNDKELRAYNSQVFMINPKQISNFKKSYSEMDKTDAIDAFVIADYVRFGRHTMSVVREEQYMALQQLTRSRYQLVHALTRGKQHFLQHLGLKCSQFTQDVESSVFGNTMMELFLERFSLEELALFLQEKGKNRFGNPEEVAKSIQKAVKGSYRLSKVVENSIDLLLSTSIQIMRAYQAQIKEIEKGIENIMATLPQTLESIPGVGPVFAAGIVAEIGQINRFNDETRIAKYAGLFWKKYQSGRFTAESTSLTRSGNHYLRYYLVEAANSVRRHVPEYRNYYAKKSAEVPKHKHKRALVLTARKFVRLVDALLSNNQIYTPGRSVDR